MKTVKNKKGFTLIELIVVIAILGVLALILVPQFMGYVDDADIQTQRSNIKTAYDAGMATLAKMKTLPVNDRNYKWFGEQLDKSLGGSFSERAYVDIETMDGNTRISFFVGKGSNYSESAKLPGNYRIYEVRFDNCRYEVATNTYTGSCKDVTGS